MALDVSTELSAPRRALALPHALSGYGAALVAVTFGWLVNAWPWLVQDVTIPWDGKAHFQAQISFLAQSLARGESPFWAPFIFAGHPQIADPQALIFSPPAWLAAWLFPNPSLGVLDALAYLHLLAGALFVLAFGRDRGWHPAAAAIAALAFAFGGSAAWRNQHIGQVFSLAHVPIVLFFLARALEEGRRRRILFGAAAGIVTALMLTNRDQVAFLAALTFVLFAIGTILDGPFDRGRLVRLIAPLGAGAIAGFVVLAVPIALVLTFADMSNRPAIDRAGAEMGSLHPTALLTLVIANLFGTNGPAAEYWGAPSTHWPYIVPLALARNMSALYMGVLPLAGLVYGLSSGAAFARGARTLSLCFVFVLLYALGRYSPLFGAVYALVPGVDLFRRPADATFLVGAYGALLAGIGFTRFFGTIGSHDRGARVAVLAVFGFFFVLAIGVAHHVGRLHVIAPPMVEAALICALSLVILARMCRARPTGAGPAALFGLAALVAADLAWNNRPNESTGLAPATYDAMRPRTTNATIGILTQRVVRDGARRDRVELAGLGFHWPNLGLVHGLESTLGYNPLRLGLYARATGAQDHVSGPDQRRFSPLFPSYRSPLANLLGLRFIAVGVPIEQIDPTLAAHPLPLVAQTADGFIYENPDATPRVGIAERALHADQDAMIASGEFPTPDPMRLAALEPGAPLVTAAPGSTARITHYGNTRIDIAVTAPGGGTLLLNDVYHPWWRAEVDGVPTPVYRANAIFRAIILPPGARTVRFTFAPFAGLWSALRAAPAGAAHAYPSAGGAKTR